MAFKILAINPGSTSTKIGIYEDTVEVLTINLSHSSAEISIFVRVTDQFEYRLNTITDFLTSNNLQPADFSAVVGRGGLLKPVISGTYEINSLMLSDVSSCCYGEHASNLGAMLASMLAEKGDCPSLIVDPVVVDELDPVARISGLPEIPKRSIFHALNQKSVAKIFAKQIARPYHELNLIVAHLGGGISVGCHKNGLVVEVNNALDGDGPFSPERAGTVQAGAFAELISSKKYASTEIPKLIAGKGGLVAHLNTNDARVVEKQIQAGNMSAKLVYEAMIYQIGRYIAAAAVPVKGKVDFIILTGGIAYSEYLTSKLKDYVDFIAPVVVVPGENELQSLAEGAYRVLTGEEKALIYK